MDLYSRYLLKQATGAFLLILLSLTGVVWIATALMQLTLLTSKGQDAWTFIKITLLAIPNLVAIIAPIALLIAVIHTLNKSNADSELIVMTASGAPVWRFARPFMLIAGLLTVTLLALNLVILPWSVRTLEAYVIKVRTDLLSQVIQPGEFTSPEDRLTFHIRERTMEGELLGLVMHDERDPNVSASYISERAIVVKRDPDAYLVMYDGHVVRRTLGSDGAQIIVFDQYAIDIAQMEPDDGITSLKPRARYLGELLNPAPDDLQFLSAPGKFRSELHERFASVLYPIAFVMIALAHLGLAQTNRTGRIQPVITAFTLAAGARLAGLAATNLVALKASFVPLVYLWPLACIAAAAVHVHLRMTPRAPSSWRKAWDDRIWRSGDWLASRLRPVRGRHVGQRGGA